MTSLRNEAGEGRQYIASGPGRVGTGESDGEDDKSGQIKKVLLGQRSIGGGMRMDGVEGRFNGGEGRKK